MNARLDKHKGKSTTHRHRNNRAYNHFNQIGWANVKIVLVADNKDFQCENIDQLTREEQRYLDLYKNEYCLNVQRAHTGIKCENAAEYTRTWKRLYHDKVLEHKRRYRLLHHDKLVEDKRRYYEQHADQLKEKVRCDICDCMISFGHFKRHEKSRKHQLNLQETKTI